MDSEKLCKHPLEELVRLNSGLYTCKCGANGTIGAGVDGRLTFTIQPIKPNRAEKRRQVKWLLTQMKKVDKKRRRKNLAS